MDDKRFYWLINRVNAGTILKKEFNELLQFLEQNPDLRPIYEVLTAPPAAESPAERTEAMEAYIAHYAKMQLSGLFNPPLEVSSEPIAKKKKNIALYRRLIQIAALLLLLGLPVYFFNLKNKQNAELVLVAKKGAKNKIVLADGTKVWLNVDSKLFYSKNFNGATREVVLSGEAYFEVAHDKRHPFIISANGIKVKVLGTAFNLKAYPDDDNTETTLIHGLVEVSMDDQPLSRISLKPGEKLKVHNANKRSSKDTNEKDQATVLLSKSNVFIQGEKAKESLWKEDKLVFDAESFEKVAVKLGRWYDKEVIINDDELKQVILTGTFENNTLEQVLSTLKSTTKFNYQIDKNLVYIQTLTSTKK